MKQRSVKQCAAQRTTDWPPGNGTLSCFSETDIHDTSTLAVSGLQGNQLADTRPDAVQCLGRCVLSIAMNTIILIIAPPVYAYFMPFGHN